MFTLDLTLSESRSVVDLRLYSMADRLLSIEQILEP